MSSLVCVECLCAVGSCSSSSFRRPLIRNSSWSSGNYFDYLCGYATAAFNECIKVGFPVELSTTNYLQIGCHMNTLFRRQVVSYLGSGVLFSTKGPSECILTYAHLKWT
jgi:hypothetical protein